MINNAPSVCRTRVSSAWKHRTALVRHRIGRRGSHGQRARAPRERLQQSRSMRMDRRSTSPRADRISSRGRGPRQIVTIESRPQVRCHYGRLIVPSDFTGAFDLHDFRVENESQILSVAHPVPCSAFWEEDSPERRPILMRGSPIEPGQRVVLVVGNKSGCPMSFQAALEVSTVAKERTVPESAPAGTECRLTRIGLLVRVIAWNGPGAEWEPPVLWGDNAGIARNSSAVTFRRVCISTRRPLGSLARPTRPARASPASQQRKERDSSSR